MCQPRQLILNSGSCRTVPVQIASGYTGVDKRMKESYREGPATHSDPESCDGGREADIEALTGAVADHAFTRNPPY